MLMCWLPNAGTSACPDGKFYCRNRGHVPLMLKSSFVDDGICGALSGVMPPQAAP